jgi:hypothetical protein
MNLDPLDSLYAGKARDGRDKNGTSPSTENGRPDGGGQQAPDPTTTNRLSHMMSGVKIAFAGEWQWSTRCRGATVVAPSERRASAMAVWQPIAAASNGQPSHGRSTGPCSRRRNRARKDRDDGHGRTSGRGRSHVESRAACWNGNKAVDTTRAFAQALCRELGCRKVQWAGVEKSCVVAGRCREKDGRGMCKWGKSSLLACGRTDAEQHPRRLLASKT